jgi:glycosyltransferase involved in cell wall biosynthesis
MPNEPAYELFNNASSEAVEAMALRLRLPPGRRRLLYVGRFAAEKRVDLLLRAFAAVAPVRPEWDLVLIGDGPLRDRLQATATASADRVFWTGAVTEPEKLAATYRLGDVLVLPSDYEPWAVVVNEATASGLALVCSDVVGAARELLVNGENGYFFRAGDQESLESALLQVTEPGTLSQFKARSRQLLSRWRDKADPIKGFRDALETIGQDHC